MTINCNITAALLKKKNLRFFFFNRAAVILQLIVIGSFAYFRFTKTNKMGGTYDRKQVYPKITQTKRPICH